MQDKLISMIDYFESSNIVHHAIFPSAGTTA